MPQEPQPVRLADYRPYPFMVEETRLAFDIREGETAVECEMAMQRVAGDGALVLHGSGLTLDALAVDGRRLAGNEYAVEGETLTIFDAPDVCRVRVNTRIHPETNSELVGLYRSGGTYCTQCEAEGFRRITYYPDRPDVLARFTTTIAADAERCPVLLSNGNLVAEEVRAGRRTVTWEDPFPKPSYLFALVAGDLDVLEDEFVTSSGRAVALRIYSAARHVGQCAYAMDVLKRAMAWDERRFGREYDLDVFMVAVVEDFNAGAMENKGLNIFNTPCVLASPDTATDAGYQRVEGVVAHEYFHNWSGNRVTCRDWFQLSLKEGFTVYRDSEFSAEMNSRTVKRVEEVNLLRTVQFVEDGGPRAHPVRPESYLEIDNFYTTTVYEKGAELVRMLATTLGRERFRAGCDRYFARHDGHAVTIEDFVVAMEDASGMDLAQFRRWYEQAGTPVLAVREERRGDALTLAIEQSCPATPGQPRKRPFHVPLALGLIDAAGRDLLGAAGADGGARLAAETRIDNPDGDGTVVAHLTEPRTALEFSGVPEDAQVSFLRGFSAPVRVDYPRGAGALRHLAAADGDGFARWDAAQTLLSRSLLALAKEGRDDGVGEVLALFEALLEEAPGAADDGEAKALLAAMLTLPSPSWLLGLARGEDILALCDACDALANRIAGAFDWLPLAEANATPGPYRPHGPDIARRQLRHRALWYALRRMDRDDPRRAAQLLAEMQEGADNLTDRLAALDGLLSLVSADGETKERRLAAFYERWAHEGLVVDAWLSAQAKSDCHGTLERVTALEGHAAFDLKNPNKVRSLFVAFTGNLRQFHAADGAAYRWAGERILALDALNPKGAARFATKLADWPRFDAPRGARMRAALAAVGEAKVSADVREVVDKGLSPDASR